MTKMRGLVVGLMPRMGGTMACLALIAMMITRGDAQAVATFDYGSDSVSDARLGIALAAIGNLVDTPDLLARPSSQQFIDDTFARIALIEPDARLRAHAAARRDALAPVAGVAFDGQAAAAALTALESDVLSAGGSRTPFIAFGVLAEQTDFNARVLRDAHADTKYRSTIGRSSDLDALVAGLPTLRGTLAGIAPGRWDDIANAAEAIVAALLGSDFEMPFPRTSAVWLILLRTRVVSAAGSVRRAPHYYLDIVRYDGTHTTIGAYPGGGLGFDHDAKQLVCAIDHDAPAPSERAIPVLPGLGSTNTQLAAALQAGCTPARMAGLRYRPSDADDDRFIADLLFRNGVNVAPLFRAATRPLSR